MPVVCVCVCVCVCVYDHQHKRWTMLESTYIINNKSLMCMFIWLSARSTGVAFLADRFTVLCRFDMSWKDQHTVRPFMTCCHILRRNCLLKCVIKGTIEGTGRQGRGRKQLLDDFKERWRYWKSKEKAIDHTLEALLWKNRRTTCWW